MGRAVFKELANEIEACIVGNMGRGLLLARFTVKELQLSAWISISVAKSTHMRYGTLNDSGGHRSSNSDGIKDHLDAQQLINVMCTVLI